MAQTIGISVSNPLLFIVCCLLIEPWYQLFFDQLSLSVNLFPGSFYILIYPYDMVLLHML